MIYQICKKQQLCYTFTSLQKKKKKHKHTVHKKYSRNTVMCHTFTKEQQIRAHEAQSVSLYIRSETLTYSQAKTASVYDLSTLKWHRGEWINYDRSRLEKYKLKKVKENMTHSITCNLPVKRTINQTVTRKDFKQEYQTRQ